MMHEDQLFQQFKAGLENYSPEVPASTYGSMRKRLWMSQFLKFNTHRLNAWYVGIAIAIGVGVWSNQQPKSVTAQQGASSKRELFVKHSPSVQSMAHQAECNSDQQLPCSLASATCRSMKAPDVAVAKVDAKKEGGLSESQASIGEPAVPELVMSPEIIPAEPGTDGLVVDGSEQQATPASSKPKKKYKVVTYRN
jgi:hypothetical protein